LPKVHSLPEWATSNQTGNWLFAKILFFGVPESFIHSSFYLLHAALLRRFISERFIFARLVFSHQIVDLFFVSDAHSSLTALPVRPDCCWVWLKVDSSGRLAFSRHPSNRMHSFARHLIEPFCPSPPFSFLALALALPRTVHLTRAF
jgi:hypothetical protein